MEWQGTATKEAARTKLTGLNPVLGLTTSRRPGWRSILSEQIGYSLIETVVVVGFLAIVLSVGVPQTSVVMRQYRLVGTTDQLAFEINRARMRAVGQSVLIRIRFAEGVRYRLERSTDGVTFVQDGPWTQLPAGITVSGDPGPTLNRRGLALSSATQVVSNGFASKTIRTNLLGRVTIS